MFKKHKQEEQADINSATKTNANGTKIVEFETVYSEELDKEVPVYQSRKITQ